MKKYIFIIQLFSLGLWGLFLFKIKEINPSIHTGVVILTSCGIIAVVMFLQLILMSIVEIEIAREEYCKGYLNAGKDQKAGIYEEIIKEFEQSEEDYWDGDESDKFAQ